MTINKTSILISTVLCAVLSTPAYAGGSDRAKKAKKSSGTKIVSTLIMSDSVDQSDNQSIYLNFGIPNNLITQNTVNTQAIENTCFPTPEGGSGATRPKSIIGSALAFLAPKLIGLFVKEVDKGLEKEIEKYSAVHSKKIMIEPYATTENKDLRLSSNCFRYSKFTESYTDQKSNGVITRTSKRNLDLDFIGQWSVIDNNHIRIRPLRLYVDTPAVPKDSDELSLAISAKASGVWRDENVGKSEDIFNTIVLKDKLTKPNENDGSWTNVLKFYKLEFKDDTSEDWSKFQALPILPYSKEASSLSRPASEQIKIEDTIASLEISVAEVGDGARKDILKLAKKGLGIFKDDITSVLEEAASELLEKETPVIDTVEKFCATFSAVVDGDGNLTGGAEWTPNNETCDGATEN